jgi:hypothetical protein
MHDLSLSPRPLRRGLLSEMVFPTLSVTNMSTRSACRTGTHTPNTTDAMHCDGGVEDRYGEQKWRNFAPTT